MLTTGVDWCAEIWGRGTGPDEARLREFVNQLFEQEGKKLFLLLRSKFGSRLTLEDTEDVYLEAFRKAYQAWLKMWTAPADWNPAGFLWTIARHDALNHINKDWRITKEVDDQALQAIPAKTEEPGANSVIDRLLEIINSLADSDRQVLLLTYVEDLSGEEIAMRLGVAHAAVRKRQERARQRLRLLVPNDLLECFPG